ncbi:Aerobic carbon monoxide dehydrogenase (quinone), large chain [hydrothermal vent metagenome]|uniref:Aerobic carbon monoxide dehydrogenase (Quinone), large chain n=1 Tax=hydrothermal vent metagenome TaxID=652676 RepID=A0A3B0TPA3_9ZZZZ
MTDAKKETGGIGEAVLRREDFRFLKGKGNYVDDIQRHGQNYAVFVRSPEAHAEIKSLDISAATSSPGVVAVLTGDDIAADEIGGMPCGWGITSKDGSPMHEPAWPILAQGRVRYVGDMVACVIAETKAQARDAAEKVQVNYASLPAIAATGKAMDAGAPQMYDDAPKNICFDWELGDKDATDTALAASAHVIKLDLVNQRLVANPMEPRAALAEWDENSGMLTLHCTSQAPHVARLLLGAFVLSQPENKFRVISPDVGGGFGSKIYPYAEYAVMCYAARKLGISVRWTSDRSEAFLSDAHGRDHVTVAELGLDADGKFTALKVNTVANMGAYLSAFAPLIPTFLYATLFAGQYTTPAIYCDVQAVFTNTTPVDAYRGAGRPEATFVLERLVEMAANELGIDPAEIRRRNFVPADAFPYATPVAFEYDSGDYAGTLAKALEVADYDGFAARKATAKANGKLRGIGISTPIEATGAAPSAVAGALGARAGLYESAEIRFTATGTVTVFTGTHSHGQGHATTFAQVVATQLGIPYENVDVVEGDTANSQFGMGTYASRSLSVGGSAIVKACDKIIAKGRKIAAHLMEASVDDVEFENGNFKVSGTDKTTSLAEVAFAAYVPHNYPLEELEPGLNEQAFFDPVNFNFPYGAYVCEVEVDPDTGVTDVVSFVAIDDVGNIINPMVVHGQIHGGVVQGIGQALLEQGVYDEDGQLVTGSFMDYTMPRADDMPSITSDMTITPCPQNPLGVKGCGEIGAIGAPPAVINAVVDALSGHGVTHIDMPATPAKVWQAIHSSAG